MLYRTKSIPISLHDPNTINVYHTFFFACMTNEIQILLILFPFILGQISLYLSFQVKHDVSYALRETYLKEASTYTQEEKTADFLLNIQNSNTKLSLEL